MAEARRPPNLPGSPQVLLGTRLLVPSPRPRLVARPRLIEQLNRGLAARLVLVSGPAGYGKTTLLAEWLRSQTTPVCWLSLDAADNDPMRFLSYLIAALQTAEPEAGADLPAALRSPQPPPMESALTVLLNDLSRLSKHLIVVLDDYHVITSPSINAGVVFFLDNLPPHVHLAIATRADPPIHLARLRSRGQMVEIRAQELRFTLNEAAAFLTQVMGLSLREEQVVALDGRTEGWVAGLQMAALSMQGRSDVSEFIAAFSGSHRFILDFLVEEVLSREPEEIQTFLLETSALDQLTASLCDAVTGRSDSQATLERLERANLFLAPLDEERRWYRYHHLFSDLLRTRLSQVGVDRLWALHRRAGEWYAERGLTSEAVRHLVAGGALERAAQLVERSGPPMVMRGDVMAVQGWLGELGDDLLLARPWLSLLRAWTLLLTGKPAAVDPWLLKAEGGLDLDGSEQARDLHGQVATVRAYVAAIKGDSGQAVHWARLALERLPESSSSIRGMVHFTEGGASVLRGDLPAAIHAFGEAASLGRISGNLHIAVMARCAVAGFTAVLGSLHRAAEIYREAMDQAIELGGRTSPLIARVHSGLSELEYEWNDLEAAGRHAEDGAELGRRWGNADVVAKNLVVLSRVRRARGDAEGAERAMGQAEQTTRDRVLVPDTAALVRAGRVRLWLEQGDQGAAARWVRESGVSPGDGLSYMREVEHLTLARVLLAEGRGGGSDGEARLQAALEFLTRLEEAALAGGRTRRLVEVLVLRALACVAVGDHEGATATLERALSLAEPEGYVRTFVDEGQGLVDLLRHVASGRSPHRGYARELLAASEGGPTARDRLATPGPWSLIPEPLSERELQVLRLIAAGKSNREIALELVVAESTVKTHVNNILGKLGARSRTQALAEARSLGIL